MSLTKHFTVFGDVDEATTVDFTNPRSVRRKTVHRKEIMNMENKESLKEYMLKEIEIIQDIIKRMAFNSLMIKGWAITLVVVSLLLKGTDKYQIWIAFIPLLVFWFLDAYFLWQERLYRELYDWVVNNRLKTDEYLFDMNAYRFKDEAQSKLRIMFSITLGWFYGSTAIIHLLLNIHYKHVKVPYSARNKLIPSISV